MQKKPYKKVYLEVTNRCNLSCDFCIQNKRVIKEISISEFQIVLEKLKPYTDYLYLHILGEPLIHSKIHELINLASKCFFVNITTNGYLIEKLEHHENIRQVNISLHSYSSKYHISLNDYLEKIFHVVDKLIEHQTYVSLRLWVNNSNSKEMIDYVEKRYDCKIDISKPSFKIKSYLFIHKFHEFIWPDLENDYYQEEGSCYGLRDQFGILVDGTIVPCCLDTKGVISLGNIYKDDLNTVLSSDRCKNMKQGFSCHKKIEELCKHCSFLE